MMQSRTTEQQLRVLANLGRIRWRPFFPMRWRGRIEIPYLDGKQVHSTVQTLRRRRWVSIRWNKREGGAFPYPSCFLTLTLAGLDELRRNVNAEAFSLSFDAPNDDIEPLALAA